MKVTATIILVFLACVSPLSSSTGSPTPKGVQTTVGSPSVTPNNTLKDTPIMMSSSVTFGSFVPKYMSVDFSSSSSLAPALAPKDPTNKSVATTTSPPIKDNGNPIASTKSESESESAIMTMESNLPPLSTNSTPKSKSLQSPSPKDTPTTNSSPPLPLPVRILITIAWRSAYSIIYICYKILSTLWTVLGLIIAKSYETTVDFILTWFFPSQWSWWTLPFLLPFSAVHGVLCLLDYCGGKLTLLLFAWTQLTGLDPPTSLYELKVQLIILGVPFSSNGWKNLFEHSNGALDLFCDKVKDKLISFRDKTTGKIHTFCKKNIPGWKRLEAKWIICGWNVHHYHSFEAIKKHYRKKALKFHPDKYNPMKNGNNMTKDEATAYFRKIKDAYEILEQ